MAIPSTIVETPEAVIPDTETPADASLEIPTPETEETTDFDDLLDDDPLDEADPVTDPTPAPDQQEPAQDPPIVETPAEPVVETPAEDPPVEETPADPIQVLTDEYDKYFTDDMVAGFAENPKAVFTQMAAQMHNAIFQSLAQGFTQALPQQIQQVTSQAQEQDAFRTDFFKEFPQLSDPKYESALEQTLNLYVQQNPESSREQIIKSVGQIAIISLNATPAATPAPVAAKPAPAFTPASPGGNGPASTETPDNEFAAFYEELQTP